MVTTLSVQEPSTMSISQQNSFSQFSLTANAARDPLPIIPRRSQPNRSSSPPLSAHSQPSPPATLSSSYMSSTNTVVVSPSIVTITPATPPKHDSDSASDGSQRFTRRRRRSTRSPNPNALYPPELSTPIPTFSKSPSSSPSTPKSKNSVYMYDNATPQVDGTPPSPLLYTPGMPLRFSIDSLRKASNRNSSLGISFPFVSPIRSSSSLSSISVSSTGSQSTQGSPSEPHLIRKKSGQVVRSSLKSSSSYCSSLSGSALGVSSSSSSIAFPSSKSEPATPMCNVTPTISKAVHFDSNLEHVKLFLAGQKPLAVSREGSPIDTDEGEWDTGTSGTESEARATLSVPENLTSLIIQTNIPPRSSPFLPLGTDMVLESLLASSDKKSIIGSVLVRNLAYEKSVSARFSLDGWCTTSEVAAKWKQSVGPMKDGTREFDRFGLVIWLGDLKLNEERRLELALRYRVEGRSVEMWDNNMGGNYVATLSRVNVTGKTIAPVPFSDDELSDLLEKAVAVRNFSKSADWTPRPTKSPLRSLSSPPAPAVSSRVSHTRTRSFPLPSPSPTSSTRSKYGWMKLSPPSPPVPVWPRHKHAFATHTTTNLGLPRDLGDDARVEKNKVRRHQRGGYFDLFSVRKPSS